MSEKRQNLPSRLRWPEWLLPAFFLPSWLMSLGFHMIVFVGVALFFQRTGVIEGMDDSGRVVDIFVKDAHDNETPREEVEPNDSTAEQQPATDQVVDLSTEESLVENLIDVPLPIDSVLAAGPPEIALDLPESETAPSAPSPPPSGGLSPGPGETRFMGIKDKGTRFVFVIDCSGSMAGGAIRVAKEELKNSISLLDPTQQFQVIYYNDHAYPWNRRGRREEIYWANDTNKRLAYNFIDERGPNGGTDHVPALMMALRLGPEVVYFLTDADQNSRISNRELARLSKSNGGRSRIHCIEFGVGPQIIKENFLTELARKNGGSYRYLNVKEFKQ